MLQRIRREGDHVQAYTMGAAGQWHNTWLGISAAFGIPAAIIWAFVWLQLLKTSYRVSRPPQGDLLLDQRPAFDPTDAEPIPDFVFDESLPDELDN